MLGRGSRFRLVGVMSFEMQIRQVDAGEVFEASEVKDSELLIAKGDEALLAKLLEAAVDVHGANAEGIG